MAEMRTFHRFQFSRLAKLRHAPLCYFVPKPAINDFESIYTTNHNFDIWWCRNLSRMGIYFAAFDQLIQKLER